MARILAVELSLYNDGPDIHADVEDDDGVEADLGTAALVEVLHVEDITEAKATDASERLADSRNKQAIVC